MTDPNTLVTTYAPDYAMRVGTVTSASGATVESSYNDPAYPGKDGLIHQTKLTYLDGAPPAKIQTTKQWLDGAGRTIRAGSGVGATPTSFNASKTVYDGLGRVTPQQRPTGRSIGMTTPAELIK